MMFWNCYVSFISQIYFLHISNYRASFFITPSEFYMRGRGQPALHGHAHFNKWSRFSSFANFVIVVWLFSGLIVFHRGKWPLSLFLSCVISRKSILRFYCWWTNISIRSDDWWCLSGYFCPGGISILSLLFSGGAFGGISLTLFLLLPVPWWR